MFCVFGESCFDNLQGLERVKGQGAITNIIGGIRPWTSQEV